MQNHSNNIGDVSAEKTLAVKHNDAYQYLGCFHERDYMDLSIEEIATELPVKDPESAREAAAKLRTLLEKKDVPWQSIGDVTNISFVVIPDEAAAWKWLEDLISVLEGNVSQEYKDFWANYKGRGNFLKPSDRFRR